MVHNPGWDGKRRANWLRFSDRLPATPGPSQAHLRTRSNAEGCTLGYERGVCLGRLTYTLVGGCVLPCEFKLPCGHICSSLVRTVFPILVYFLTFLAIIQCHADLDNHKSTRCYAKCVRLACIRQHPCIRLCYEQCGNCEFPISDVMLPCGHVEKQVPWYVRKAHFSIDMTMNSHPL